jgi:hypothetical protein
MKKFFALAIFLFVLSNAHGQTATDSVKAVINKLFAAMKSGDGKTLQDCFADSAILQTLTATGRVHNELVADFAAQISRLPKGAADERITFDVVKVDDGLALAWTPYQFYYQEKFSHCGVDSFQLIRVNGQWKIQYLIDTRRKNNCQ